MAITINGNTNTIAGLAVGGLPDGTIDNGCIADDAIGIADLAATGTASSSTYLRGDNSWSTAGTVTKRCVAWASFDGTSGSSWKEEDGFSALTDVSEGTWRLTVDSTLTNTEVSCVCGGKIVSTGSQQVGLYYGYAEDTDTIRIGARMMDNDAPSMAVSDLNHIDIAVFDT